jgi:hypothetical protein
VGAGLRRSASERQTASVQGHWASFSSPHMDCQQLHNCLPLPCRATMQCDTHSQTAYLHAHYLCCPPPAPHMYRPVPPETPKLLPLIASSWGPALAALRSHRAPQVERGLDLLAALTKSGGGAFMARRFSQEAAPLLSRLLAKGPSTVPLHDQPLLLGGAPDSTHSRSGRRSQQHRSTGSGASVNSQGAETRGGGAGDDGEAHAPGTLQRVRAGVLGCLTEVCRCKEAWTAVRGLTWAMAQVRGPAACADRNGFQHMYVSILVVGLSDVMSAGDGGHEIAEASLQQAIMLFFCVSPVPTRPPSPSCHLVMGQSCRTGPLSCCVRSISWMGTQCGCCWSTLYRTALRALTRARHYSGYLRAALLPTHCCHQ